jgi:hypothetical protein
MQLLRKGNERERGREGEWENGRVRTMVTKNTKVDNTFNKIFCGNID